MADSPIKNPELLFAMKILKAEDTPEARRAFGAAMGTARFLAPVKFDRALSGQDSQPGGSAAPPPSSRVNYLLLERASDHGKIFPAFTDWDELHKWQEGPCETMTLTLQSYARLLAAPGNACVGLAVNPASHNLFVAREGILASAQPAPAFNMKEPIQLGTPKELPQGLADGLQAAMAAEQSVQGGWLRLMEQKGKTGWLLAVELEGASDAKAVLSALAKVMAPLGAGLPVTVTQTSSPLGKKASANALPLYVRGREAAL